MTPGRTWAACLAAIFGLLAARLVWRLLHEPAAFLWLVAIAAFVGLLALAAASHRFRAERDEARVENEQLERECDAHAAENARLNGLLTDARVVLPIRPSPDGIYRTERPDLSIVPPQRSDSWLEDVMDEQARLGKDGA